MAILGVKLIADASAYKRALRESEVATKRWASKVESVTAGAAPSTKVRDVCIAAPTGGGGFNMFIFRDVESLTRGEAISLKGLFFTTVVNRVAPFYGSAAMVSDGTVRLGLFVNSTAESTNDFTISGMLDANFVGLVDEIHR